MKKFITLFLLLIVVHLTNGKTMEFPTGTNYYFDKVAISIWSKRQRLITFSPHAVIYVEHIREK